MRIIGGERRGLKLADVGAGDAAAHLRPTSDRVREAIFNLLTNGRGGDVVRGARVLDLFAGTGALGLEALSRGAAEAVLVDNGRVAQGIIRRNIGLMGAGVPATLLARDATALGVNGGAGFGLIFLDPPYGKGLGEKALVSARDGGWLSPGATVVWEETSEPAPPKGFNLTDRRRYGGTVVTLLAATE
jgi:16S rRNA (guanine966-N2)-methyltransferase